MEIIEAGQIVEALKAIETAISILSVAVILGMCGLIISRKD